MSHDDIFHQDEANKEDDQTFKKQITRQENKGASRMMSPELIPRMKAQKG